MNTETFFEEKLLGLLSYFSEPYGGYNDKMVSGTKKIEEFKR